MRHVLSGNKPPAFSTVKRRKGLALRSLDLSYSSGKPLDWTAFFQTVTCPFVYAANSPTR